MMLAVIVAALVACLASIWRAVPAQAAMAAGTIHVSPTGQDNGLCGGIDQPCATIQYAVNKAANGSTIRLLEGIFTGQGADIVLINGGDFGLSIEGAGIGKTIVDGQGVRRCLEVRGQRGGFQLRQLTIRNCKATGSMTATNDVDADGRGGGLLVDDTLLTLVDVLFENNLSVGGVNVSGQYGGAGAGGGAYLRAALAGSVISRTSFINNVAQGGNGPIRGGYGLGGGLFAVDSKFLGIDLDFERNQATGGIGNGSGITGVDKAGAQGGGSAIQQLSVVTLQNIRAISNTVRAGSAPSGRGGNAQGGGLHFEVAQAAITLADIRGNKLIGGTGATNGEANGGGISTFESSVVIDRSTLMDNNVYGFTAVAGGAYFGHYESGYAIPNIRIVDTIVARNVVSGYGHYTQQGYFDAGALWFHGVKAKLDFVTIANNSASSSAEPGVPGCAIRVLDSLAAPANVDITNMIMANEAIAVNIGDNTGTQGNKLTLKNTLWDNVAQKTKLWQIQESGSITGPARFRSIAAGNFHIASNSTARDAGTTVGGVTVDIDGQPRSVGALPDIGADEYVSTSPVAYLPAVRSYAAP